MITKETSKEYLSWRRTKIVRVSNPTFEWLEKNKVEGESLGRTLDRLILEKLGVKNESESKAKKDARYRAYKRQD
jgi:hypothetical protein